MWDKLHSLKLKLKNYFNFARRRFLVAVVPAGRRLIGELGWVKLKLAPATDRLSRFSKHKKVRIAFFSTLIICGLAILLFPQWPRVAYELNRPNPEEFPYLPNEEDPEIKPKSDAAPVPEENRVIIPKIGVNSEILEAHNIEILSEREGVWHDPKTDIPTEEGNMVIAGHRFQYLPPNTHTFYNLEEIHEGDKIYVLWEKEIYKYEVYTTLTVTPAQTEIRKETEGIPHELTIYTCTPLYSSAERFVVKAKLI